MCFTTYFIDRDHSCHQRRHMSLLRERTLARLNADAVNHRTPIIHSLRAKLFVPHPLLKQSTCLPF